VIPIIDPGIAKAPDQGVSARYGFTASLNRYADAYSAQYGPHDRGVEKNVFIHMTNGSITWGRVWPGDTVCSDY